MKILYFIFEVDPKLKNIRQEKNSLFPVTQPTLFFFYPTPNFFLFLHPFSPHPHPAPPAKKKKRVEQRTQGALAKKRKKYQPIYLFFPPVTRNKVFFLRDAIDHRNGIENALTAL